MFLARITIIVSFVFSLSTYIFSQNQLTEKKNSAFGVTVIANWTADYNIQRNYVKNRELDVDSASPLGLEVRLTYEKNISQKINLYSAVLVGYYSVNYTLLAHKDFLEIEQGDNPYTVATYNGRKIPYSGLSIGGNYGIFQKEKTGFYFGLAMDVIYFLHPDNHDYYGSVPFSDGRFKTFIHAKVWKDTKKLKVFPEISLLYRKQIGDSFIFTSGITGIYSNYRIVSSDKFELHGDSEIRTGSFYKKFAHIGLNMGVLYLF